MNNLLSLKEIKIEDLNPVRYLSLDEGISFQIETDLEDKGNENSCNLTYYEIGESDNGKFAIANSIVAQFLNEPFFDALRTKQQIGYVVISKAFNCIGVLRFVFIVQSSTKSCEFIVDSINQFLI